MTRLLHLKLGSSPLFYASLLCFGSLAWAANPVALRGVDAQRIVVTDIAGEVDVKIGGIERDVRIDSTLDLPARIVTGKDGALGIRQSKTSVSVAPDSDIEIPAAAHDGQLIARMIQHRGNAFYDVETRDVGRLRVETPYLVAVIKGTQFNVAVQGNTSTISLFEGRLEIQSPNGSDIVQLEAGEIAIRSENDVAIRVIRMDEDVLPRADAAAIAARPRATADRLVGIERNAVDGTARSDGIGAQTLDRSELDVAAGLGTDLGDRKIEAELAAGLNVEKSSVLSAANSLDAGIELGGAGAAISLDNSLDLGAGSVDLGLDVGADLGGTSSIDVGLEAGVDLGAGSVDLGLDLGGTSIDVGSGDLGLDTGSIGGTNDVVEVLPEPDPVGNLLNRIL